MPSSLYDSTYLIRRALKEDAQLLQDFHFGSCDPVAFDILECNLQSYLLKYPGMIQTLNSQNAPMSQEDSPEVFLALLLSMTEVGLGSVLHAWHIPLSGTLLCCNQIFLLTRASIQIGRRSKGVPLRISLISALYKGMSPIGKRLTPMLAISMQGILFTLGEGLAGKNLIGRMLGAAFASLWGTFQKLFFVLFIFGDPFLEAAKSVLTELNRLKGLESLSLSSLLIALLSFKMILGIAASAIAHFLPNELFMKYVNGLSKQKPHFTRSAALSPFKGAFKDMLKTSFLLILGLSTLFLYLTTENASLALIYAVKALVTGYLSFLFMRLLTAKKVEGILKKFNIPALPQDLPNEGSRCPYGSHFDRT